jgi:hypothetical protein
VLDLEKRYSYNSVVGRGVAGSAGAMRVTPQAPVRAAGGPRQGLVPQAQLAYLRLKHASVVARPTRSYSQRLELAKGPSPREFTCHCSDKAGSIYSAPL